MKGQEGLHTHIAVGYDLARYILKHIRTPHYKVQKTILHSKQQFDMFP